MSDPTTECNAEKCGECVLKRDGDCKGFVPEQPTTGEIVRSLRCAQKVHTESAVYGLAADRLESQERELSGITGELERFRTFHERYAEQTSKKYIDDVAALTARAEQAEKERNLAVKALTDYEDALFDEKDKAYNNGYGDGYQDGTKAI